jgi:hypothetical protein
MLTCQTNIIKCSAAASKESDYVFAGFLSSNRYANDQAIHIILYGLLLYLSVYCTFAPNKMAQITFCDIKTFYMAQI